jgi:hypothetical protein
MTLTQGMKSNPSPRPVHTPWARKICQYSVAKLVARIPRTERRVPVQTVALVWPASARRPATAHRRKVRKTWMLPIQLIWDEGR